MASVSDTIQNLSLVVREAGRREAVEGELDGGNPTTVITYIPPRPARCRKLVQANLERLVGAFTAFFGWNNAAPASPSSKEWHLAFIESEDPSREGQV